MHVTGKKFGKTCRKAVRDTVFSICDLWSEKIREAQNFLAYKESPPAYFPSILGHSDLPIKKSAEGTWFAYYNDFEKKQWENFFFKATNLLHVRLKTEKK